MSVNGKITSTTEVDQFMLQEILWRREEANSALSNLYLRGTVLTALAVSLIGLVVSSTNSFEIRLSFAGVLTAAAVLGLISFWPLKNRKYKLATIEKTLKDNADQANLFYLEFVKKDYLAIEKAITWKTKLIKIGFIVCISSLPALLALIIGDQ